MSQHDMGIYSHEMIIQLLMILVDKGVISADDREILFARMKAAFEPDASKHLEG